MEVKKMFEGNVALAPSTVWDGKARKRETPEEIAAWIAWNNDFFERMRQAEKEDPLPDDFIEYCKGHK
jgi:hypothetical protein